jgi:hypothetical protein
MSRERVHVVQETKQGEILANPDVLAKRQVLKRTGNRSLVVQPIYVYKVSTFNLLLFSVGAILLSVWLFANSSKVLVA